MSLDSLLAGLGKSKKLLSDNPSDSLVETLLTEFGKQIVEGLGKALPPEKDATGNLRQSIKFQVNIIGNTFSVSVLLADYYKYVDQGRKPGTQPPVEPILKWLQVKNTLGLKTKNDKPLTDSGLRSVAFLIARSIKGKGIAPTNFFTKTVNDGRMDDLKKTLSNAMKRDVSLMVEEENQNNKKYFA